MPCSARTEREVRSGVRSRWLRTWGKGLLKLLGLVGVLEDEGVDAAAASDLELDVVGLLVLLDAGSYKNHRVSIGAPRQLIRGPFRRTPSSHCSLVASHLFDRGRVFRSRD